MTATNFTELLDSFPLAALAMPPPQDVPGSIYIEGDATPDPWAIVRRVLPSEETFDSPIDFETIARGLREIDLPPLRRLELGTETSTEGWVATDSDGLFLALVLVSDYGLFVELRRNFVIGYRMDADQGPDQWFVSFSSLGHFVV